MDPEYTYTDAGIYTVTLTTFSEDGVCSDQSSVEVDIIVVSVDELTVDARVWPNPTNSIVMFESTEVMEYIEVYTLAGSMVQTFQPQQMRSTLTMESMPAGTYLVKIGTASGVKTVKLVRSAE